MQYADSDFKYQDAASTKNYYHGILISWGTFYLSKIAQLFARGSVLFVTYIKY